MGHHLSTLNTLNYEKNAFNKKVLVALKVKSQLKANLLVHNDINGQKWI